MAAMTRSAVQIATSTCWLRSSGGNGEGHPRPDRDLHLQLAFKRAERFGALCSGAHELRQLRLHDRRDTEIVYDVADRPEQRVDAGELEPEEQRDQEAIEVEIE